MADWCNPGIDLLTNWGKDVKAAKAAIISEYSIEVKWLTDQYWPWHLCKSSYETYETQTDKTRYLKASV